MASKQVQELKIVLGVSGADKLAALKGAFRGLTQTIGVTDNVVSDAVASIKNYVETASRSEAVIKGQITAFEALKSQADVTGTAYQELDVDIKKLKEELRGASDSVMKQRDSLIKNAASTKASSGEVARYVEQLKKLQGQTRQNSEAFKGIEEDIESLTQKMAKLRQQELADFGKKAFEGTRGAVGGLKTGVEQSIALFKRLGEQSRTALGIVGRSVEGIAAIGAGGAIAGVSAGGLGNIASLLTGGGSALAGLRQTLGGTPLIGGQLEKLVTPEAIARLNEAGANLAALQSKVAGLDQAMDAITTAFTAFGPTASAGAIAASAGIAIIYDRLKKSADETRIELEKSFKGIDDEVQALMKDLVKLNDQLRQLSLSKINELLAAARGRFAGAPAGSPLSRSMASQIAGLEAMARQESAAQAQVLEEYRQRVRGTSQAATDLSDRLSYLRARLQEVDTSTSEGKAEFASLSRESLQLSEALKKLGDGYRHVSTMATQAATAQENAANAAVRANYFNRSAVAAQERAMAELGARVRAGVAGTPLALPAAGGTTAPGTGQEISGGARRLAGQVETTFGPAQFRNPRAIEFMGRGSLPTAATGAAAAVGQSAEVINRANKSYSDLLVNLREVLLASNGSISSLERQRSAWNALREAVDPASKQFANSTKQIEALDARLKTLQTTQQQTRRRMTGMQVAQAAGAAVSGGIFGGPEGFLGGALGGVFGGVGGAFAGAAAGAQVGALRQQLGGFADYAAQIQKMEIALKNAAGSQDQFNQAMAAASAATQNLNVPQDVAIQGMTKLTAAVKGAGGQVSDAELVFKNVTAAIKATGGSAQDVDGAITAMVQVFSKGKVSAEELSGQLGERLPGAVTKFAKANDMTLPELQKALEQGQVGLNELMNFIVQLGDEYAGVAEKIAGSSQDAGARLTVAYNNMRIAVGEALQPIGAAFQEAFIPFIEGITPVLVDVLPKLGQLMLAIAKNFDTAAIAVGAFMGALAISKISLAITALGGLSSTLLILKANAVSATGALQALNATVLLNPWTALAAGVAAVAVSFYNAAKEKERFDALMRSGSAEDLKEEILRLEQQLASAEQKTASYSSELRGVGQDAGYASLEIAKTKNLLESLKSEYRVRLLFERVGVTPDSRFFGPGFAAPKAQLKPTEFPTLTADKTDKAKSAADKAAREAQRRFDQELQNLVKLEDRSLKRLLLEDQIKIERSKQEAIEAGALDSAMQMQEIASRKLDLDVKQVALSEQQAKLEELRRRGLVQGLDVTKVADKMQENMLTDLELRLQREQLATQELKTQTDLRKEIQRLDRSLNQELQDRSYQLGLITEEQYNQLQIERERQRLEEQYRGLPDAQGRIDRGVDLFRREIDPTFAESLQTQIALVKRDLDELTKPINQVVGAASAIGDAFTESFTNVITGSTSAKQALSDFFKNVGKYFLDMAAQIIQRMIVLAILNQIVGLLPGGGGGPSGPVGPLQSGGDFNLPGTISTGILPAANGMAFAQNGIQPFANGGIVTKPTFFKFAKGGAMGGGSDAIPFQLGVMGEAGPEAIMPLKRGADGKLGVAARLDGAMKRYRATPGSAAAAAEGNATADGGAAGATMEPIDVRYTVERINSVDYVTADQFRAGMQQAAQQGAAQGEQRTLRRLQQSPSTRRRIGV